VNAPLSKPPHSRAIVIGGSVAGLVTARVLADFFQEVVILERDAFPTDGPDYRKGLPQARHQHILLTKGREVFEQLFPGFDAALAKTGAELADHTEDMALFSPAGRLPRFRSGIVLRLASRIQIDWILLGFLRQMNNVRIVENTRVQSLPCDAGKVTGVTLEDGTTLTADWVVDASGRGSIAPKWLQSAGFDAPPEETIDAKLGYASRFYERSAEFPTDFKAIAMTPVPLSNPRGVGMWQVEGNRWLLTLIGTAGHFPPTDEAGFAQFASKLADPVVVNTMRHAKPCSDIVAFKGTANRWRHFERVKALPERFVVIGDAFCAFSPFYGQGMTMAARSALAMRDALNKHTLSSKPNFQAAQAQYVVKAAALFEAPWVLATGEDLRWPSTTGAKPDWVTRASHRIMDTLLPLSTSSTLLVRNFLRISNMTASPATLLDPRILSQLVWHWLRRAPKPAAPVAP
jgi:2-polyprenyl-6-methoxyphenol hydroxylase-like FAD-dependent oxidoreductase